MASVAVGIGERRRERRLAGGGDRFEVAAVLRPGQTVALVNISSRAALVASSSRLRPGARTELHLCGAGSRAQVKGRIDRCRVVSLDPMQYHGVIMFDESLDVGAAAQGSE